MSIDENLFHRVIDVGLRFYGNGRTFSSSNVRRVEEKLRQFVTNFISLRFNDENRFLINFLFFSRHKIRRLKRFQQYLQAKDRQDENLTKRPKISPIQRFERICRDLNLKFDEKTSLDRQRTRQYVRLDEFYRNENLTTKNYLTFVEEQSQSFNKIRSLSTGEILRWLKIDEKSINEKFLSIGDFRFSEFFLFLLKEFLLDLMDEVFRSKCQSSIEDVFRRRYVKIQRRKQISRRKRF